MLVGSNQLGNVHLQDFTAVGIECWRIVDRRAGRQRAEASVQMVETAIDQFEREHLPDDTPAYLLVCKRIAAKAIASKENGAAKERIPRPFKVLISTQ